MIWNMGMHLRKKYYHSVLGKHPWALKYNSRYWPAWALTQDQNPIRLYRSCYSGPLKCSAWALTREWALARDTMVITPMSKHHYFGRYLVKDGHWVYDSIIKAEYMYID